DVSKLWWNYTSTTHQVVLAGLLVPNITRPLISPVWFGDELPHVFLITDISCPVIRPFRFGDKLPHVFLITDIQYPVTRPFGFGDKLPHVFLITDIPCPVIGRPRRKLIVLKEI